MPGGKRKAPPEKKKAFKSACIAALRTIVSGADDCEKSRVLRIAFEPYPDAVTLDEFRAMLGDIGETTVRKISSKPGISSPDFLSVKKWNKSALWGRSKG